MVSVLPEFDWARLRALDNVSDIDIDLAHSYPRATLERRRYGKLNGGADDMELDVGVRCQGAVHTGGFCS
jgi:hypothetical protein